MRNALLIVGCMGLQFLARPRRSVMVIILITVIRAATGRSRARPIAP
jgi:hypothetical protein